MIINGREIILKSDFDAMLDELLAWFEAEGHDDFAQTFVKEIHDAIRPANLGTTPSRSQGLDSRWRLTSS